MGQRGDLFGRGGKEVARLDAHFGEQLRDEAVLLGAQRGEQMLLFDGVILVFDRQALGVLDGLDGFLGELVHVHRTNLLYGFTYHVLYAVSKRTV